MSFIKRGKRGVFLIGMMGTVGHSSGTVIGDRAVTSG